MDFVVHDASIEFFLVTVVGMNDALNQLGWVGEFIGPTENNETSQIEFLNSKINQLEGGRDALATSVLSDGSYRDPIRNAIDEGIPVVNINTSVDWSRQLMLDEFGTQIPYVGQPDFPAGNAVGQAAFGLAEAKIPDQDLVFQPCVEVPGHPALQTRIDGVINYLESQAEVEVLSELQTTTDVGEARSRIGDALDANPGINMLIGTFSPALTAAARIGQERDITDELVIGGFDTTPLTYEQVQAGNADFTTTQDPYSQGFMPPQLVFEYLDRGVPMKDYQTDISILTREDSDLETTSPIDYGAGHIQELRSLYDWQQDNYNDAETY
jgi:ABC-type sugar transport system substrate-binding protein